MIDLRSDTLTKPSRGMREAMLDAEVGDDVYAEDPTVAELERRTAALFGQEAALFCPTGTMTNLLGVAMSVKPGQELLVDEEAHIIKAEMGGHAVLNGVSTRTWYTGGTGRFDVGRIAEMISPRFRFLMPTGAVAIENTNNFSGGAIQPIEDIRELSQVCRSREVALHLDGARIWNAHIATGVSLEEYGALCDTISVCFSKGLGAPIGSIILSTEENIAQARFLRRRLGGSWRQAGIMAAGALYALDHNLERLADDHAAAKALAAVVAEGAPEALAPGGVDTNIVVLQTGDREAADIAAAAKEAGVLVSVVGPQKIRAVTHLDVSMDDCIAAGERLVQVLR